MWMDTCHQLLMALHSNESFVSASQIAQMGPSRCPKLTQNSSSKTCSDWNAIGPQCASCSRKTGHLEKEYLCSCCHVTYSVLLTRNQACSSPVPFSDLSQRHSSSNNY